MSPRFLAALLALAALPSLRAHAADTKKPPPSFVVILTDDQGYGDLASYGHKFITSPHLDALGKNGIRLTSCYASAPVCSPSRAGMLTGRNPYRAGIRDWIPPRTGIFLHRDEIGIAKLLQTAGYATGFSGKWHLNSRMDGSEPTPGDHGFQHWFATQNNAIPTHQNPTNFVRNGKALGKLEGNSSTLIADEALRFLRSVRKDQPFLLFVWFHAPHEQVATPEAFTRPYAAIDNPHRRTYYGSISLVDREVGRLLRGLDDLGRRANTLVWFTSDNGPETLNRYKNAFRSHGTPGPLRGMKLHLTEGGIRVPGILSWPGVIRPGQVVDTPVSNVDLLPTLCDIAGVPLPRGRALDGVSIRRLIEGKPFERTAPLYWQYDRALGPPWKIALRQGNWKLLADDKLERFALYDLGRDLAEANDLAGKMPGRVKELAGIARRLHREINAGPGKGKKKN